MRNRLLVLAVLAAAVFTTAAATGTAAKQPSRIVYQSRLPGANYEIFVVDPAVGKRADEIFLTRTAREWEDYCAKIGVEGTTCYTAAEWLDHPLARPKASKIVTVDGRPWTCAGPLMLREVEKLRRVL